MMQVMQQGCTLITHDQVDMQCRLASETSQRGVARHTLAIDLDLEVVHCVSTC